MLTVVYRVLLSRKYQCSDGSHCWYNLNLTNLRTLSSDYSLKRHRSTCVEAKAAAAAKAMDTATSGADMCNDEWYEALSDEFAYLPV